MKISIIAAMAENRAIGLNNKLIWHLPADLKRFKTLTTGKSIIMGRKTWDSIGRPLPNRQNIVITRNPNFNAEGAIIAANLEQALESCVHETEVFIIGGGEIYGQAFEVANTLYLTLVHAEFVADTHFPEFDLTTWKLTEEIQHMPDEKNTYRCTFLRYEKVG